MEPVDEDTGIQMIKFSFVSLRALSQRKLPATVDLCGVIVSFKSAQVVTSKEGAELTKREITIADHTATSMVVTLWGDRAKREDIVFEGHPSIALKSVLVKEFRESRVGSLPRNGVFLLNSDMPEALRLQRWWTQGGSSRELSQLSPTAGGLGGDRNVTRSTVAGLRRAIEKLGSQPEFFSLVARLAMIQMRKQGEVQSLSLIHI